MFRTAFFCSLLLTSFASSQDVLLIPESSGDSVGMYSPVDGSYLGDFHIDDPATADVLQTPIEAFLGPDGVIWVTDQVSDGAFRFDLDGTYLGQPVTGLDNCRGASHDGTNVFIATSNGVFEYTPAGVQVASHADESFDVLHLPDGRFLIADTAATDGIERWESDWTLPMTLFATSFPEQVSPMISTSNYLTATFTSNSLIEFMLDGTIVREIVQPGGLGGLRGVYELENGQWIFTNASGVHTLDPNSGAVVTVRSGIQARFVNRVDLGGGPIGGPEFIRGDANADGVFDISDAVFTLASLFIPGSPPAPCQDAGDANNDELLDISDAVAMLAALFIAGTPPLEPTVCGEDPDASIGCATYAPCP